jgi:hypothetical protein
MTDTSQNQNSRESKFNLNEINQGMKSTMKTTKTLRHASLLGAAVMGLTLLMPMAAQAGRGDKFWAARPQARALCVYRSSGHPPGRPYECRSTGTTSNQGVDVKLPGDRGTIRF